jgi:DNA repair protein SbcD/Mre11
VTEAEFGSLRACTHYVALGHIHKPFEKDGWLYNPGSLECCGSDEDAYPHGLYIVDVDTANTPPHTVRHVASQRRTWIRQSFAVDSFQTMEDLSTGFRAFLDGIAAEEQTLAVFTLTGTLAFSRRELDLRAREADARERLRALHVDVRNDTRDVSDASTGSGEAVTSRDDLERLVLTGWFAAKGAYVERADAWAAFAGEVKEMTLRGEAPESIIAVIRQRGIELGRITTQEVAG